MLEAPVYSDNGQCAGRDIYYSDPACFGSQRAVDTVIDDLAHTMGVDRMSLNVVLYDLTFNPFSRNSSVKLCSSLSKEAAAKGLVTGRFRPIPRDCGASHGCASDKVDNLSSLSLPLLSDPPRTL